MENNIKEFHKPENADEAFAIIENLDTGYSFIAGGVSINWRGIKDEVLVSLEKIIESEIIDYHGAVEIGAGVKISELKKLKTYSNSNFFQALADSAELIASPQIRNMATIGGNFISGFDFSDTSGFIYLTEPDLKIINRFGILTQKFSNLLNKEKLFVLPKETILNSFIFSTEILQKYVKTIFLKESRVKRDIATISITAGKKNNSTYDIAIGSYWVNTRVFSDIKTIDDIKKHIESMPEPKSDFRASSEYRKNILIHLCGRVIDAL